MIKFLIIGLSVIGLTAASAQTAQPIAAATEVGIEPAAPPAANPQSDAARAWGYADSDIPVDTEVRFGVLPNGMKYALRRNTTPLSTIAMRLQFDVGSLAEADDERGLAHFLEHMAFNGSTNVPEGEMVRLLERLGLAFGADTNASTGFDSTSYRLDLPGNDDELIDTGLMLFWETANELTIATPAVDRERGVILSERRARDNFGLRNQIDALEFGLGGTLVPERLPIGTEASIAMLSADQIHGFYDGYYRPERATLVIVGDFDVDAMEARVVARFIPWLGRGAARPDPVLGELDFARPRSADIFVHPAIAETVEIDWLKPWTLNEDSQALRRRGTLEAIGERILRRRFSRIALASGAPISGAGFTETDAFDLLRTASVTAQTRDGQWREALVVIEQELRRAIEHGFSDAEVAEQVAGLMTGARNAVASQGTRTSGGLAGQLLGAADGRAVVSTPDVYLAMTEALATEANAAQVTAAFRNMMADYGEPLVRVTSKVEIADGEATLIAAYGESAGVALAANVAQAVAQFAYTNFGPAGTVVSDDRIVDLDIRRVRFANGVMLNIKRTDFEDDRVRMSLQIDGGGQLATADDPTRLALTPLMTLGGLAAHSTDELQSILAGRSVGRSFGVGADAFGMSAATTPQDMLLQAQLFTATLLHPGYRPEAIDLLRRVLPAQYAATDATPGGALSRDIGAIIYDDHPLTRTPPLEVMMALEWQPYRTAIADSLDHGAIEIAIVGDVEEDAAIAAIAATLGAIPSRRAAFVRDPAAFERRFAQDLSTRTLTHRGEADQAIVQTYWSARDDSDQTESIGLDLLGAVMGIMLTDELRERLGQTYSPNAGANLSFDYPGFGYLYAAATVAPADIESVEAAIMATAAVLRDTPISDDLLTRARQPIVESATRARRDNGYWIGHVLRATSRPELLDRSRNGLALLQAVTAQDLTALARRYLGVDRALQIRVVPRAPDLAAPPAE